MPSRSAVFVVSSSHRRTAGPRHRTAEPLEVAGRQGRVDGPQPVWVPHGGLATVEEGSF